MTYSWKHRRSYFRIDQTLNAARGAAGLPQTISRFAITQLIKGFEVTDEQAAAITAVSAFQEAWNSQPNTEVGVTVSRVGAKTRAALHRHHLAQGAGRIKKIASP